MRTKKYFNVLLVFAGFLIELSLNCSTLAQSKALLKQGGKIVYLNSMSISSFAKNNADGTADTLNNDKIAKGYNTIFTAEGEDIIAVWFVSPVDLIIKACGIDAGDNPLNKNGSIKIVRINKEWTEEKLKTAGVENLGYWISDGVADKIYPYSSEVALNKKWNANTAGALNPIGDDLLSDNGNGAPFTPTADGNPNSYQWINMSMLNNEPSLKKGEIFAVCIKNMDVKEANSSFGFMATNETGYGVFKYYAKGRTTGDLTTAGWWKREYLINVAVAVEITGDEAPTISDVDILPTALTKDAREVNAKIIDTNPSGGPVGVEKGYIEYYLNNDATWKEVTMVKGSGDFYKGSIPGQQPGTKVTYRIKAKDVSGNVSYSNETYNYNIFAATTGTKSLLVFNGFNQNEIDKYPMNSYFKLDEPGKAFTWPRDVWAYGPLTTELVNNYTNIIEICSSENSGEKIIYNDEVIKIWLLQNGTRNYALAGQEWLGVRYGFIDRDFTSGSFEYDILGITHSYNDVASISSSIKPSRVFAKQGSLLGDDLYKKFTAWGTDSLQYDPYYELNNTENWIDGFEVVSGQAVDMEVETIYVNGIAKKQNSALATHRALSGGNKIAFFGYDPIAINTKSPNSNPKYYCFGTKIESPQMKVLQWFNVVTDIMNERSVIPTEVKLFQNYPNPFNPETTIGFHVPIASYVTLKIYDALGSEVITLLNDFKNPGIYDVKFNGKELASGIYFYRINCDGFSDTKKLILIK